MSNTAKRIKKYKELKADIVDIDIKIQELKESGVENNKEYIDKLTKEKIIREREIARIDNALSILKEEERDIVETALINQKKYGLLEIKYNRTYARIKQIECDAVKKMERYLY